MELQYGRAKFERQHDAKNHKRYGCTSEEISSLESQAAGLDGELFDDNESTEVDDEQA